MGGDEIGAAACDLRQVWVIHARYRNYDGHCWAEMHTFSHLVGGREWLRKERADPHSDLQDYTIQTAWQEEE